MFQDALALHRRGRLEDAARAYESVLASDPEHVDALIHLGVLRLGQGFPDKAETLIGRAATIAPHSPEAHANLAAALQAMRRYAEAVTHYRRAFALRPGMLDAQFGLASCLQALDQHTEAIACYEALLAAAPKHPEANFGLATLFERLGHSDEAVLRYRDALAADPDFAEASFRLGTLLSAKGRLEEAIARFDDALDVDPDYVEASVALGAAFMQARRDDEAIAAFQSALAAEPQNDDAHVGLAKIFGRKRRHVEAIDHCHAALAEKPAHIEAMAALATSLKAIGRHDEALATARRVLELRPDLGSSAGLLASILAEIGSTDEAVNQFRRAIALAPARLEFAYHLLQVATVRPDEPALRLLQDALPQIAALPTQEQCMLHFGLAKAYEDLGEKDRGFTHLLQGNAIRRAEINYDEASTIAGLDRLPGIFTPELLAARKEPGDRSEEPVFIVGMPRSGTTLVEQILASHPSVFGAGERAELSASVGRLKAELLGAEALRETLWATPAETFRQMGADYVAALRPLAPSAARITDKMPINFVHVGLIHLILPRARIIHVVRDPVDTCLSCFSKLFAGDQPFAYDLAELGRFYRAYTRLMAHWRALLPANVMLEVRYETLVQDFEPQARRLVAHCGIEWDPASLDFHKTPRAVQTASMNQVRQPIFKSSIGRWRPDPALLRPLLDALGTEGA
jgi:tetratricopeptide (TPR) repeat protein